MIVRCPCCRASLKGAMQCPRCRADLENIIKVQHSARQYLKKAIQDWNAGCFESSLNALEQSFKLHKTRFSCIVQDFFIRRQYCDVLEMLAENDIQGARQRLYQGRRLLFKNHILQQLHFFIEHKALSQPVRIEAVANGKNNPPV